MTLTPGGTRLLGTASQIVVLGAEAHAAVRAAQGAPEQLRIVATSTFAEFVAGAADRAFRRRFAGGGDHDRGGGRGRAGRADREPARDVAIGPGVTGEHELPIVSEPVFKYRLVVVGPGDRGAGAAARAGRQWRWLVDPSGTDPESETARLCAGWASPTATSGSSRARPPAWAAAADRSGVAPAIEHLVSHQLRRGELSLMKLPSGRGVLVRDPARAGAPEYRRQRPAPVSSAPRRRCS